MIDARTYLTQKGIHVSLPRVAIMDFLLKHRIHPTADEIYLALYPKMPTLSRTTVYNTLKLFAKHDAIQVIGIEEKNARYDACTELHAHFLCTHCGTIFDIPVPEPVESLADTNKYLEEFIIHRTYIYHKGICPKCKTHEK